MNSELIWKLIGAIITVIGGILAVTGGFINLPLFVFGTVLAILGRFLGEYGGDWFGN